MNQRKKYLAKPDGGGQSKKNPGPGPQEPELPRSLPPREKNSPRQCPPENAASGPVFFF